MATACWLSGMAAAMPACGPTAPPPRLARVKANGEIGGAPADPPAPGIAGGRLGIGDTLDMVGIEAIVSAGVSVPTAGAAVPSGFGNDAPAAVGLSPAVARAAGLTLPGRAAAYDISAPRRGAGAHSRGPAVDAV
jgi:hypothetical protein